VDPTKFKSLETVKQFFSVRECAEILGVSERTVERMIRDGDLRAVKLRRRTLVHFSAIDELVQPYTANPPVVLDRRRRKKPTPTRH
jgi:excisionase family DNA binding protein